MKLQKNQQVKNVMNLLNLPESKQIGEGGEGWIFELDENRVIKIWNDGDEKYLKSLKNFQDYLSKNAHFSFEIPQILEIKKLPTNIFYTIEKRLFGFNLETKFPSLTRDDQFKVLEEYFNSVLELGKVELSHLPYGNILDIDEKINSDSWQDFLIQKLRQRSVLSKTRMKQEVKNYEGKVNLLEKIIKKEIKSTEKCLVHGDYYLNNVLVDDALQISAVLDLSQHMVVGNPLMDATGAISFLGINPNVKQEHFDFLFSLAEKRFGKDVRKILDVYTLFYSFYYCYIYRNDLISHEWNLRNLNNEEMWGEFLLE